MRYLTIALLLSGCTCHHTHFLVQVDDKTYTETIESDGVIYYKIWESTHTNSIDGENE